jgi:hypothetical protein
MKFILFLLLFPLSVLGQKINRKIIQTSTSLPSISNLITDFDFSNQNSVVTYHNKITQITDAVGSIISSQSDTTKQPIYHHNGGSGNNAYATFSGGQFLAGNLPTSSTNFTMVIIRRVSPMVSANSNLGTFQNGNTNNGYGLVDFLGSTRGINSGVYYPGVTSEESADFFTGNDVDEIVVCSHSASNTKIYNCLANKFTPLNLTANPIAPTGGHIIGKITGLNYFIGDISRILVYDRQLSDSEVLTLTTYLIARYITPIPGLWNSGGDSITATAQGSPSYNYPVYTLIDLLPSTRYLYLINSAVSGRNSQNVIDSLNSEVVNKAQPRVKMCYSLLIGHNNLTVAPNHVGIDTLYNQTVRICSLARAAGYKVVLLTLLNTTVYAQSLTDTINNRYRNRWHTLAVDTLLDINADPHLSDPTNTVYFFDGQTHLSLIGAQRVDSLIRPVINSYLTP